MRNTDIMKHLLFISSFILLTFNISAQGSGDIYGPDFVYYECCETFSVTLRDSMSNTDSAVWVISDNAGVQVYTTNTFGRTHQIEICPDELKLNGGVYIITFTIPSRQITFTKTIQIDFGFLEIFFDHDCVIEERSNSITVCQGAVGMYQIESTFQNVTWDVTGGTILDQGWDYVNVKWDQPGTGRISVFAFGPNQNCTIQRDIEIFIVAPPTALFESSPALDAQRKVELCLEQNIRFQNESLNAGTYQWDFGDGHTSDLENPEHSYDQPGVYTVTLITPIGCGCTDTTTSEITVLSDRAPILTCIGTICPQEEATYYVESDCDDIIWTVSANGIISDGGGLKDDHITVVWQSGPYGQVTVQGQNCPAGFCSQPNTFTIPIISQDGPIEGDTRVCLGEITSYSAPFFQGTNYYWTISNGGRIIGNNTTSEITVQWERLPFNAARRHFVKVAYDNCYLDCGGEDSLAIEVLSRFEITGIDRMCETDDIYAEAFDYNKNQAVNCRWELLNELDHVVEQVVGFSSNFTSTIPLSPGTYRLFGTTNATDYCEDVEMLEFEVVASPSAPMAINGPSEICPGSHQTYTIDQYQNQYNVVWTIQDGPSTDIVNGGGRLSVAFLSSGPYGISAQYVDAIAPNCTSQVTDLILTTAQYTVVGNTDACFETVEVYTSTNPLLREYNWIIDPPEAGQILEGQGTEEIEVYWTNYGNHAVRLEACLHQEVINVNVVQLATPEVIHPQALCPDEVRKVSLKGSYDLIEWKDNQNAVITTDRVAQLGPGEYFVVVSSLAGCKDSTSFTIEANPVPEAVVSINGVRAFCETEPFAPRTLYANTNGNYNYQWFKDGTPLGLGTSKLDVTEFGTYHVIVSNGFGCAVTSNSITLVEHCGSTSGGQCTGGKCRSATCPDIYVVSFSITDDPTYCNIKTFKNTSTVTVLNHHWLVEDLQNSSWDFQYDQELTYTFPTAGYYTIVMDGQVLLPGPVPDSCVTNGVQVVAVPVAADLSAMPVCAGEPMEFNDISTFLPDYSIVDWSWEFGDPASGFDNNSSLQNPDHVYNIAGTYNVTLTITSSDGCLSTITKMVEVKPNPIPDFSLSNPICEGSSVKVSSLNDHFDITWFFNDPNSTNDTTNSKTSYHVYDSAGIYNIELEVTDLNGCVSRITKAVNIIKPPVPDNINIIGDLQLCLGESVDLEAPLGDAYIWNTGESTRTITVVDPGDYFVEVILSDGCRYETPMVTVTVDDPPHVRIIAEKIGANGNTVLSSSTTLDLCVGDYFNLISIADQSNLNYRWSNGYTTPNQVYRTLTVGTYIFDLEVSNAMTGCESTSNKIQINVHPYPTTPQITSDVPDPICEGQIVNLTVTNFDATNQYVWSNGDKGANITVIQAGEYKVRAIGPGGCAIESRTITIWPVPNADAVLTGCYKRCSRDTFCLSDIPNVSSVQWYKDGVAIPSPEGQVRDLVITVTGVYNVELTGAHGCSSMSGQLEYEIVPGYGDISVNVYLDVNKNGIIDAGDILLEDIEITTILPDLTQRLDSTDQNGNVSRLQTGEGLYDFNITDGRYTLVHGRDSVLVDGCDEKYEINLLVRRDCQTVEIDLDTTICLIDTIVIATEVITQEGNYRVQTQTAAGCDSFINVTVVQTPAEQLYIDTVVCHFDTIVLMGQKFFDPGSYIIRDTTSEGCLEITEINFDRNIATSTIDTTICLIDTIWVGGDMITTDGQYQFTLKTNGGCDSVVNLNVSPAAVDQIKVDTFLCNRDSIDYMGFKYYDNGSYIIRDTSEMGCLSITELNIQREIEVIQLDTMVCDLSNLILYDSMILSEGFYQFDFINDAGCIEEVQINVGYENDASDIDVTIYLDINENGIIDAPDSLLSGIPLRLLPQAGGIIYGQTDAGGFCQFGDLDLGKYQITIDTLGWGHEYIFNGITHSLALDECGEDGQYTFLLKQLPQVFIPNVFTPNGDEVNDVFRVYTKWESDIILNLSIYDRWGELMFSFEGQGKQQDIVWDGRFNNTQLNPAVFVYKVEVLHRSGKSAFYSGDVTLVR